MSKIFITGSSDGIGLEAAKELLKDGHEVVLHARNNKRAYELDVKLKTQCTILTADLCDMQETKCLADELNKLGTFDVIIHNAGVYHATKQEIFKVNVLAPYILTSLMNKPKRLIYIGSNMHPQGSVNIDNISQESGVDYSTSKLLILMLSLALARIYKDTLVNTVDPGWVRTKMANYNAPISIEDGAKTQVWLSEDEQINYSGKYFHDMKEAFYSPKADNIKIQDRLLQLYEDITNIKLD